MKKGLFIINPSSGRQNIMSTVEEIIGKLIMKQISTTVEVFYTEKKDDAKNRAAQLKPGDFDFIVAVGGDGTLNEVASGLYLSESHIPLAVISAGTVNDFANYMNLPQKAEAFVDMIEKFICKDVDLGQIDNEYFINVVAGGMLTDIAYKVPKDKKAAMGKMAYYTEAIFEFPKQMAKGGLKLKFDSEEYHSETDAIVFLITNSKSVGGVPHALPLASVSDGLLDVLILKRVSPFSTPDALVKFVQGEHHKHPDIKYFQTKKVRIELVEGDAIAIDYDGEILENRLTKNNFVDISIIDNALKIIVPEE
jgi:diacylglycerol kinase (ATP)